MPGNGIIKHITARMVCYEYKNMLGRSHVLYTVNGRKAYTAARMSHDGSSVVLSRRDDKGKVKDRYISPGLRVKLVPVDIHTEFVRSKRDARKR